MSETRTYAPLSALRAVPDPDSSLPPRADTIRVRALHGNSSRPALTARKIRALTALAAGATDLESARIASVSTKTIKSWRREPEFAKELHDLLLIQRERIEGILGRLAGEAEAVLRDALTALGDDGKTHHATRLRAAEAVLNTYVRISQKADHALAPPAGPLIVLPPGTQRMALALDDDDRSARQLPAAGVVGPPQAPDGLHLRRLAPGAGAAPPVAPDAMPIDVAPRDDESAESEQSTTTINPAAAREGA